MIILGKSDDDENKMFGRKWLEKTVKNTSVFYFALSQLENFFHHSSSYYRFYLFFFVIPITFGIGQKSGLSSLAKVCVT